MNKTATRPFTRAELATQALEMLAIGNVAVHRAQARNRALGIANHYSVAGRIVTDVAVHQGGGDKVLRSKPL